MMTYQQATKILVDIAKSHEKHLQDLIESKNLNIWNITSYQMIHILNDYMYQDWLWIASLGYFLHGMDYAELADAEQDMFDARKLPESEDV